MRRNRSDLASRDYHCPCGKAYLSYPALYTHIKKYHKQEDQMLEHAIMPFKEGKRGRPKDASTVYINQQLEELTRFQLAILKIYERMALVIKSPILLEGNAQINPQQFQLLFSRFLHSKEKPFPNCIGQEQVRQSCGIIKEMVRGMVRHFVVEVGVRVKWMMLVGYLWRQFNGSAKEECVAKMERCWEEAGKEVAELLFDVLVRALQQRRNEEVIVIEDQK